MLAISPDIFAVMPQMSRADYGLAGPASWTINKDGWVLDHDQRSMLVWIPSDLRPILLPPGGVFEISARGTVNLNFDTALIGMSWTKCFQPVQH